jgi:hypothetical protein
MISKPHEPVNTGPESAPSRNHGGSRSRKGWIWGTAWVAVIIGAGLMVGWAMLGAARVSEACSTGMPSGSWNGIQISGLPVSLQSSFGYGRGTQVIESTLTAAAQPGAALPARVAVFAEPLASSDGRR